MGSILGTSVTGWIVSLSYIGSASEVASLLSAKTLTGVIAVVGIILRMFSKKQTHHHIGDIMMGFAILMYGMDSMSSSVSELGSEPWFTELLTTMTNPFLGILTGILFAAILQSSSAAVGIIQALSVTGAMTLGSALPLLMGITIGASLPVLLSAVGANTNGKRTALSYLVASFMGVMVCASLFYIADSIFHFSFLADIMNPFSLAFVNSVLRLAILCLLAPFTDALEAVVALLVPAKEEESDPALRLEERFLAHPPLAIEQCRQTINDMAKKTEAAMDAAERLLTEYTDAGYQLVTDLEAAGDRYEDALGSYLVKLTGQELTEHQSRMASIFLHNLSDFERISDHALNIAESAREIHERQVVFSPDAMHELSVIIAAIREILSITTESFVKEDPVLAQRVEPLEEVIDNLCDEMKLHHVERLQKGTCTIDSGFVFNDLLTNFERVSDQCSNIGVAMILLDTDSFDTHEYLGDIKDRRSPNFEHFFQSYKVKYALDSSVLTS